MKVTELIEHCGCKRLDKIDAERKAKLKKKKPAPAEEKASKKSLD